MNIFTVYKILGWQFFLSVFLKYHSIVYTASDYVKHHSDHYSLPNFSIQQFHYNIPRCKIFFVFILLGGGHASWFWVCVYVCVWIKTENLQLTRLWVFLSCLILLNVWDCVYPYVGQLDFVLQVIEVLVYFSILLSSMYLSWDDFHHPVFKITDPFFSCVLSAINH